VAYGGECPQEANAKEHPVKRLVVLFVVGSVSALSIAAIAPASEKKTVWTAALSTGQEVPKQVVKDAAAHGQFKGTLNGNKLSWTLTFAKLTGSATAAHIHMAAKGVSGPVVVPLCGPCTNGQKGTATLSSSVLNAVKSHGLYVNVHTTKNPDVNVHTTKNPDGEIRGQLAAV
jgi:hypothetical protein